MIIFSVLFTILQQEDELAPLFSGAAWAGTRLWDAAIYLMRHFISEYADRIQENDGDMGIIELGAGM